MNIFMQYHQRSTMANSHIMRNPTQTELINVIDQNFSDLWRKTIDSLDKTGL
jgi:hypothetical protein